MYVYTSTSEHVFSSIPLLLLGRRMDRSIPPLLLLLLLVLLRWCFIIVPLQQNPTVAIASQTVPKLSPFEDDGRSRPPYLGRKLARRDAAGHPPNLAQAHSDNRVWQVTTPAGGVDGRIGCLAFGSSAMPHHTHHITPNLPACVNLTSRERGWRGLVGQLVGSWWWWAGWLAGWPYVCTYVLARERQGNQSVYLPGGWV